MKKISALLLALVLMLGMLTACSNENIGQALDIAESVMSALDDYSAVPGESGAPESSAAPEESGRPESSPAPETPEPEAAVSEDGEYSSKDEVALYIHTYGHLPANYITKNEAKKLGWDSSAGNLDQVAPGMSIGGDRFGNYEGILPEGSYTECDVNYSGGFRGAERLIFSSDGRIYYTADHYKSFQQLY